MKTILFSGGNLLESSVKVNYWADLEPALSLCFAKKGKKITCSEVSQIKQALLFKKKFSLPSFKRTKNYLKKNIY